MAGNTFSNDAVQRIRRTVRTVEGQQELPQTSRANTAVHQFDYMIIGKTDAAINKGASGTVSVYSGSASSSLTDTGENITAYNRFGNVASGKMVACWTMPWGFELVSAEC